MVGRKRLRSLLIVAGISAVTMVGSTQAATAHPHHGGRGARHVVVRGACSDASRWRLHLAQHRRFIGIGFQVKSGIPGQIWRVRIDHGRRVIFADLRRTSDPEGVLSVRRPTRNLPGLDYVRARAVNIETGERCRARAAI